jgi:predicted metal-dependent hydrolase
MSGEILTVADLEFEVRRSARRRTRELTVDRAGELVVHAPDSASTEELCRWIESKLLWVHGKLLAKEVNAGRESVLEVVSGETISYLGRNYRLKLVDRQDRPLALRGEWFCLRKSDRGNAATLFQKWYQTTGAQWVERRVKTWVNKVGVVPKKLAVSGLGFRWGSCGKTGILLFNWRLFQLPVRVIDYVVVHEMAHLREHNHTPEFWRILDRALPDWRERKQELQEWTAETRWRVSGATASGVIEVGAGETPIELSLSFHL